MSSLQWQDVMLCVMASATAVVYITMQQVKLIKELLMISQHVFHITCR